MRELIIFIVGILIMLVLMMRTSIGAFAAMLLAALLIAIGCGIPANDAISVVVDGFGSSCKSLGLVIIFGTMLGAFLEKSNAMQRISRTMIKTCGEDRSDVALGITGFIVGIPVFSDVALIMLSPLAKALSKRTKFSVGALGTILSLTLLTTFALVAPTPGPLAISEMLGLDVGISIMWGLLAAAVATIVGILFCRLFLNDKPEAWWTKTDIEEDNAGSAQKETVEKDLSEEELPGFITSLLPILGPIILIIVNSVCGAVLPEDSPVLGVTKFLGNKNIALAVGVVMCIILLGKYFGKKTISKVMSDSLSQAGPVMFITAAGSTLAAVVNATSIGDTMANGLAASGLPIVLVPFLISGFSKFAQGSGSTAGIMSAGLTAPLVQAGLISAPVAFVSACAGTLFLAHVNNSFFWVFSNIFGFDTKTTLKSLCVGSSIVALGGLAVAIVMSFFM